MRVVRGTRDVEQEKGMPWKRLGKGRKEMRVNFKCQSVYEGWMNQDEFRLLQLQTYKEPMRKLVESNLTAVRKPQN